MNTPPGFQPEGAPSGFLQAPEGPMEYRNPTGWQNARLGASGLLEKAGVPQGGAKFIAENVVPGSTTDAWIQGGLMLTPGVGPTLKGAYPMLAKEAPALFNMLTRAGRVALPTIGGATGAATEGKSVLGGAGKGAAIGAVGEAVPIAAEWAGRMGSGGAMERRMATKLGGAINDAVPALPSLKTPDDFVQLAIRQKGQESINTARDTALDEISAALKARTVSGGRFMAERGFRTPGQFRDAGHDVIEVPSLRQVAGKADFNLKEAVGWLRTLSDEGWLQSQKMKEGVDAVQARALREAARKEIVGGLNERVAGLGDKFNLAQNQFAKGQTFLDLLGLPGVIKEGRLDVNALREALGKKANQTDTWAQALEKRASAPEAEAFYKALFRGGDFTGRDTPGSVGLHFGMGTFGHPGLGFSRPSLPKYAGAPDQLPWYAQPGSLSGGKAGLAAALAAMGLTREPMREGR